MSKKSLRDKLNFIAYNSTTAEAITFALEVIGKIPSAVSTGVGLICGVFNGALVFANIKDEVVKEIEAE